jgi:hypothetical protein
MTTTTTPSHSFPTDRHNKGQSLKQKPDTTRPPIHQPGPDRAFLRRIRIAPPERRSTLHNPHVPRSSILIPPWPGPSTSPLFSHVHPPSAPDLVDGRACIDHGRESKRDVRLLSTATASVCLSRRRCVCVCVFETGIGFCSPDSRWECTKCRKSGATHATPSSSSSPIHFRSELSPRSLFKRGRAKDSSKNSTLSRTINL